MSLMSRWGLAMLFAVFSGGKMMVGSSYKSKPWRVSVVNNCSFNIWPGVQPRAGYPVLALGGFSLKPNQIKSFNVTKQWEGHIWGRTGCNFTQLNACLTGDCNGKLHCNGTKGKNPLTLVELSFHHNITTYTVSLLQGFNLPLTITAHGGEGNCSKAVCRGNILSTCPHIMQVKSVAEEVVACKSACQALRTDMYCCANQYNSSDACTPSQYAINFKRACPHAYAFPYDNADLIHTCIHPREIRLIFCH
ncbi:osmotin-like protein isoform X2 [Cryptomeria japonica]|uniref:osmotin-like protein isoform X2 n=1 Tax=Cryptomeria japonica TaxID=3369 RepID=UPI0027DAA2C5|nr:osmotin-like protein isoform X2 [Cryptomeria japonica]